MLQADTWHPGSPAGTFCAFVHGWTQTEPMGDFNKASDDSFALSESPLKSEIGSWQRILRAGGAGAGGGT